MAVFNWAAPMIDRFGQRWSAEDIRSMSEILAPYLADVDARLLDVGGGSGGLAVRLATALHRSVTVLDPTPELLARAPEHAEVITVAGFAEKMPFEDGAFHAAVITDAFHHFADQTLAVRELHRVLRPGGGVLLHEFDPAGWMRLLIWAERLVGEPGSFMRQDEMCAFMKAHGFDGSCSPRTGHEYQFIGVRED
jgi:ubiquinone/menaquinone biosynthesis C-methylase UbiE